MTSEPIDIVLAKRFRIERPPTIIAHRSSAAQIGFSRMSSKFAARGRSLTVPCEAAFSFHVPMSLPFFSDLWMRGRPRILPAAALGDAFLFDLSDNPVVGLATQRTVLDTLEARFPMLRGTIRDHVTQQRRPFLRFFACEEDLSHEAPDAPLPDAVASGAEPLWVVGAIAGG